MAVTDHGDHWRWVSEAGGAMAVFTSREQGSARLLAGREHMAQLVGVDDASRVAGVTQVHGSNVWIDLGSDPGIVPSEVRWDRDEQAKPAVEADALVSTREGIALAVVVADCLPIAIAQGPVIAAVHAGWRSLEAGVIEQALRSLQRLAGSAMATSVAEAVIGPALGACCMEVGEDVAARFDSRSILRPAKSPRPMLDARLDAARRLEHAGVHVEHVDVCTRCDPRCFSHRGDGAHTGRQALLVRRA